MTRKLFVFVTVSFIAATILYIAGAFASAAFDFRQWTEACRGAVALAWVVFTSVIAVPASLGEDHDL